MRYAAHIDFGYTRLKGDWLAVGQHGCGTVDNAIGFFAGVRVQYTGRSGWDFNGTDNDIHVLAGQIALGQFGSLARLSVDIRWSDKADEASESNKGAYLVIVMPMLLRNDELSHDAPPLINLDRGGGSNAAGGTGG
jgi:hypothetical protein